MGLVRGDPRDLAQTGWGVIFAQADEKAEATRAALRQLLDLRRSQVGKGYEHRYKEYIGASGYQLGDTKRLFLTRLGVGPGSVNPDRIPYYLLLVGDPNVIPWSFQYHLDIGHAVGRIWFETMEDYEHYARSIVANEVRSRERTKAAVVFAPQHVGDTVSELSAQMLAAPLADRIAKAGKGWAVRTAIGDSATKANLIDILRSANSPDLLFTAAHGVELPCGHPLQHSCQGALICQDLPSTRGWRGDVPPEYFFSANDLTGANLSGMVSFHFGCGSAGMPAMSDFKSGCMPAAPYAFIARLPVRMLQVGALAAVGHVENAWASSIEWPGAGIHIEAFDEFINRLMRGHPVGAAMEPFGMRYADLTNDLLAELERQRSADFMDVEELWRYSHDARNYVVIGDPAVRLAGAEGELSESLNREFQEIRGGQRTEDPESLANLWTSCNEARKGLSSDVQESSKPRRNKMEFDHSLPRSKDLLAFGVDGCTGRLAFDPATEKKVAERALRRCSQSDLEDLDHWRLSKQR